MQVSHEQIEHLERSRAPGQTLTVSLGDAGQQLARVPANEWAFEALLRDVGLTERGGAKFMQLLREFVGQYEYARRTGSDFAPADAALHALRECGK